MVRKICELPYGVLIYDNTMSKCKMCTIELSCDDKVETDGLCTPCWVEATVELDGAGEP
jgi:hypothetical protein